MPRKSKESEKKHKVKNIIQNVVIKLDSEGKKAKRKRKRQPKKAPVQKEVISVTANVPPAVIYQQPAIQLPIPQAFTSNPPPPPFVEPASKSFLEEIEMPGRTQLIEVPTKKEQLQEMIEPVKNISQVEKQPHIKPFKILSSVEKPPLPQKKQEPYKIVAPVEKPNIKISMTEPSFPLGISIDEFVPTGNFVNPDQLLKAQETPMKVYTEEPENFKSPVYGNQLFGVDISQIEAVPITQAINVKAYPEAKEMKVIAKAPLKGQRTITSFINPNEEPTEELHVLIPSEIQKSDTMKQIMIDLGSKKKEMSEIKVIRERYEKEFGTKYDDVSGKLVGIKTMKQKLGMV